MEERIWVYGSIGTESFMSKVVAGKGNWGLTFWIISRKQRLRTGSRWGFFFNSQSPVTYFLQQGHVLQISVVPNWDQGFRCLGLWRTSYWNHQLHPIVHTAFKFIMHLNWPAWNSSVYLHVSPSWDYSSEVPQLASIVHSKIAIKTKNIRKTIGEL